MSAARISHPSLASELRKTAAVPSNSVWMLVGSAIFATTSSICFVAAPSDVPGARLNEMVATGNCSRWLMATGVVLVSMRAKLLSGMICSRVPESCCTGCAVPGVPAELLEVDLDPPDVRGHVRAVDADERRDAGHRR